MTKKSVSVSGLDRLQEQLNALGEMIDRSEILDRVLMPAAMTARDEIKDTAPRGQREHPEGWLKIVEATFASKGDPDKDSKGPSVLFGVNAKKAPQAFWQEFGTWWMLAKPYYRPAKAAVRPMLAQMIADRMRELIDRTVKSNGGTV